MIPPGVLTAPLTGPVTGETSFSTADAWDLLVDDIERYGEPGDPIFDTTVEPLTMAPPPPREPPAQPPTPWWASWFNLG